jgi:DNA (cytosine-5)-methyltransferase 1
MRRRILILYSGAGGCTRGYMNVGFETVGIDIQNQPNYCGDQFYQRGALAVLEHFLAFRDNPRVSDWPFGGEFHAIHAGPPCQLYTKSQRIQKRRHPDLIAPTRLLLEQTGLPYVIENVPGAPLINPVQLEGQMFGLNTHRPRLFETNWPLEVPALIPPPPQQAKMGRRPKEGEAIQIVGNFSDVEAGRLAMGIDWMTRDELREAIPPAYTEFIGEQLMAHLKTRVAA